MKLLIRMLLVCIASCGPLLARGGDALLPLSSEASVETTEGGGIRAVIESGHVLRREKQFDAALLEYQRAIRAQPENGNAWLYLGITYVSLGQFEEARASFKRSILASGDDPVRWIGLCLSHYVLEDYPHAIHTCQEALRLDPSQADAWAWMGLAYARRGEWNKSIRALEMAAALGTRNSDAWYTLGMRYARQEQRSKVLQVYRRLQELDPDQARRFFDVAISPRMKG
jgi:tetratricopeptide (TPR) repeat protein